MTITVTDINDNAPVITNSADQLKHTINEAEGTGKNLVQITAKDVDANGVAGQ